MSNVTASCGLPIDSGTLVMDSSTNPPELKVVGVSDVNSQNIVYVSTVANGTPDGSILNPFTSLSGALSYVVTSAFTSVTVVFYGGTYTETGDVTFPNIPITIEGNQAHLTISGTVTIPNPHYVRKDLFTTATNVVYNNFTTGARCIVTGGSITGNMTINSYVEMSAVQLNGGVITVGNTGQLLVSLCSPTSTFISTGMLTINKINMNTGFAGYLIYSTNGQVTITESLITNTNTGSGGCISCVNTASTVPNIIENNFLISMGVGYCLTSGNAVTIYSRCYISGTNTLLGSAQYGTNSDIIGGGTVMKLTSDATGDMYYRNSTGLLTRLGIGTNGQALKVSGGIPTWTT